MKPFKIMNRKRLALRIVTFPLIMVVALLPMIVLYVKWLKNWFLYGGEIIAYEDSKEKKNIADIYLLLKDELESNRKQKNHD